MLAATITRERERVFLNYMGERVEGSLFWMLTTPLKIEKLCGSLDQHKGMGWALSADHQNGGP
jgi:hypothetical protein